MARAEPPVYQRIAADLRARIEAGEFRPGAKLPSESELQERYGVTQGTVRHAISVLREAGLAEPEHGVGVWVREPPEPGASEFDVMMGEVREIAAEVRRLNERMLAAEQALREQR